MLKQYNMR